MSEKIRVLLVDDHTLFRSGIKSLLQRNDDFEVIGEAGDGLEGIKRVRSLKPDVALLDLHMPGVSGLEAVKVIAEEMPEVRVLMLTVSEDAQDLMDALRAGASGYLLKRLAPTKLLEAIRDVHEGGSPMSAPIARKLVQALQCAPARGDANADLSPREREVLNGLAEGQAYKQIAGTLGVSIHTVRNYIRRIYEKLHVRSCTEAVAKFLRH